MSFNTFVVSFGVRYWSWIRWLLYEKVLSEYFYLCRWHWYITFSRPMTFLSELATNASRQDIGIVFYEGNNDALIAHRGIEVTIQVVICISYHRAWLTCLCLVFVCMRLQQNTTFGGIQGFTRKPATLWHDDSGKFAGIVHQERNWTYVLFDDASHTVPKSSPAAVSNIFPKKSLVI